MECTSATCLCMDHKPTFSSMDNETPCERGEMFRENETSLPTEIKIEGLEPSVKTWKLSNERKNKIRAPL